MLQRVQYHLVLLLVTTANRSNISELNVNEHIKYNILKVLGRHFAYVNYQWK